MPSKDAVMATIRKPRALRRGDMIRMVSPASPLTREKTETTVAMLEEQGYRISFGKHAFDNDFYLAGTDQDRADDLQSAFEDSEVDAILCTRGGYGCARLMPLLDLDRMADTGKMFLGFSDVTTLHLALNRRGLATVHAPMALTLSVPREAWVLESFLNVLRGGNPIPAGAPAGETLVRGTAEGSVTGGCLCLLTDSIGTPDPLDCEGKILIIEDVDENPHRVDAMLTHLRLSGVIQKAAGIVIGEMTRTDEKADPSIGGKGWRSIVRDRIAPLGIPAIVDYPFGHCPNMLTLPLGIRARMDAGAGTLTYTEDLCA
jgi:muramoyltetrapeptide carboxypeptidase